VAPSRHTAARLAEAGVSGVTVQGLGVDTELFDPIRSDRPRLLKRLGLPTHTRLLVFAGRPAREKNVESMIAAVERLGDPYRLLLIGAGKDARYSPSVVTLDYEPTPQKLASVVASCDAFLHANENEIFGLVVLEAMAAGLPVVHPASGGTVELVGDDAGVGVPHPESWEHDEPPSPEAMADAVERVLGDLDRFSAAARGRVVERFALEPWLDRHAALFARLAPK